MKHKHKWKLLKEMTQFQRVEWCAVCGALRDVRPGFKTRYYYPKQPKKQSNERYYST